MTEECPGKLQTKTYGSLVLNTADLNLTEVDSPPPITLVATTTP